MNSSQQGQGVGSGTGMASAGLVLDDEPYHSIVSQGIAVWGGTWVHSYMVREVGASGPTYEILLI